MTDSPVPGADTSREARPPAHKIVRAMLRAAGSTAALVVICYLLPLDRFSAGVAVTVLVIGLVALVALITLQVRSVVTSPFPGLWAVEALATSLPLFLVLFASTYLVTATESVGSFSQPLTHTDAPPPRSAAPPPVARRRDHHQRCHPRHLPSPARQHLDPRPAGAPATARPRPLGTGPGRRARRQPRPSGRRDRHIPRRRLAHRTQPPGEQRQPPRRVLTHQGQPAHEEMAQIRWQTTAGNAKNPCR